MCLKAYGNGKLLFSHSVVSDSVSLLQHHSSKASLIWHSALFIVQLSHPYMTTGKTIALTIWTFVGKVMYLLFSMLSRFNLLCLGLIWCGGGKIQYNFTFNSKHLHLFGFCLFSELPLRFGGLLWSPLTLKVWGKYIAKKHILKGHYDHSNKSSGGDVISAELFRILKDDAVEVLHLICQQIWKTQQWPWDWKRSVFILIPKKGNAKECSTYCTVALISHASKIILKILQARLQQYANQELPDVHAGFK